MKKLLSLVLAGSLLISCADYDDRFDSLSQALTELEAENAALEAQILGMQAASASAAQATADKLAEFQEAVGGIITILTKLSGDSEDIIEDVAEIIARIAALAEAVETNAITIDGIAEEIAAIQAMLDTINENVLHHSGGGSTAGTGSEHHSGGGSSDDETSENAVTDNGDDALDLIVTAPAGTTSFRLTGPWWGWDPNGGPEGTDNGDGTWTITIPNIEAAIAGDQNNKMEYLYVANGVQENLIDNAANGECADRIVTNEEMRNLNTDYVNYANRVIRPGDGDQAETYDSCSIDTID